MLAQSLKHAFKTRPMVRAPVHSLLLVQSAISYLVDNQEPDRTADGAGPRMLAQSSKHAFKTHPTVRAPVNSMSSAKHNSYPTCTVSNQESDRNADGANVGAINSYGPRTGLLYG